MARVPLNLPHAGTLAVRIRYHLRGHAEEPSKRLVLLLDPYRERETRPPAEEAARVVGEALDLARRIVDEVERAGAGHDRLGQGIRNLFECLEAPGEGARISLRAGERPDSPLRD